MFYINPEYISNEKYSIEKFMPFLDDNFDVLDSYFFQKIKELPEFGIFTISTEEERPDLIAYRIYNNVFYWWLIMFYNDMVETSELKTGVRLRYFDLRDLESLFYSLKSLQSGNAQ
jgi:hypothetical protein